MGSIGPAYQLISGVRWARNLRVLCIRLLAVMGVAVWDEEIGLKNRLIHSSAESLNRWGVWWLELV